MVSSRCEMFRRGTYDETFENFPARVNRLASSRDYTVPAAETKSRPARWTLDVPSHQKDMAVRGNPSFRKQHLVIRVKAASQQQCEGNSAAAAPRLGAMALQTGLAMQAGQSYPQQLVQLVGHRHCGAITWVRPRAKPEERF